MKSVLDEIKKSICSGYEFEEMKTGSYLVHTDMYYDDGDEFHIILKMQTNGYVLTDEGHTMMWLSYEDYNFTESRTRILNGIIGQNGVTFKDERISVTVDLPSEVGSALSSLIQAIMQVSNLRHLSRMNVASTFLDDVCEIYRNSEYGDLCEFGKRITLGNQVLEPDIYIDSNEPVLIFGANNTERAKEVIINLLYLDNVNDNCIHGYRTIVIVDDRAGISQKDQERLINIANHTVFDLKDVLGITAECLAV